MKNLPRILVIDDEYGRAHGGRSKDREEFCVCAGVKDVTGDVTAEVIRDPVAEAIFCRAQREKGRSIENDLEAGLAAVRAGWKEWPRWALLLLDLKFKTGAVGPDGEPAGRDEDHDPERYFGLSILDHLDRDPELRNVPVVILSSVEREKVEKTYSNRGGAGFVDKRELDRKKLEGLLQTHGILEDDTLIGHSVPFLQLLRDARQAARMGNGNVLMVGEAGTGKELLAEYIHRASVRLGRKDVYVPVFTQGVPETLLDDRLFGHVKGAFHGAGRDIPGPAEDAEGGTLFIDEFGCVSGEAQKKLLRLLDRNVRQTQRVGSPKARKVNVLVVLASDHLDMFSSEDFRNGILRRIGGEVLRLPPLRERREDIPLLAGHFIRKHDKHPREVSPEALDALMAHSWPENVGELEDVIERAIRRYPDARYLSARHLRLRSEGAKEIVSAEIPQSAPIEGRLLRPPAAPGKTGMDQLLQTLEEFSPDGESPTLWTGKLRNLLDASGKAVAGYVRTALEATRKPKPDNPDGEIEITPAMKLLTGEKTLKTPKAADIVKRLRGISEGTAQFWDSDPILKEAYRAAVKVRPKKRRSKRKDGSLDGTETARD